MKLLLLVCGLLFGYLSLADEPKDDSVLLLDCNTPSGSNNQGFKIYSSGAQVYIQELDNHGKLSDLITIQRSLWVNQDMSWQSPKDGPVRLYFSENDGWTYVAELPDSHVMCLNGSEINYMRLKYWR